MNDDIFFNSVKLAMKSSKEYVGLDPSKYQLEMRSLGYELGVRAAERIRSNEIDSLINELVELWSKYGYGYINLASREPLIFEIRDCFDCLGKMYGVDIPLCSFKEGFLEAIFSIKLGKNVSVKEEACCGTGNDKCIFNIKIEE